MYRGPDQSEPPAFLVSLILRLVRKISTKTKPTEQRNRFFAFCGHVKKDKPPVDQIKNLLMALNLDLKVWRFSDRPIFLVKQEARRLSPE